MSEYRIDEDTDAHWHSGTFETFIVLRLVKKANVAIMVITYRYSTVEAKKRLFESELLKSDKAR